MNIINSITISAYKKYGYLYYDPIIFINMVNSAVAEIVISILDK